VNTTRLASNIVSALTQVVAVGGILFVQYIYLARVLGLEQLGGWALVIAITGTVQIGQIGMSTTPVRYVSKYRARGEIDRSVLMARTAILSVAFLMALLLPVSYPLIVLLLEYVVDSAVLDDLLAITPIVLCGTWFLAVGTTLQSCLDGCQRIDLRAKSVVAGSLVQLISVLILVPLYGLMGVAFAYLLSTLITVGVALYYCGGAVGLFSGSVNGVWSTSSFREMLSYGAQLQLIGITLTLFLPLTKLLISNFGSLAAVGVFELANRVIIQVRQLIVDANRTLVPVFSATAEETAHSVRTLYEESYSLNFALSFPVFAGLAVFSPQISQLFTGEVNSTFVIYSFIICSGCLVNSLSNAAYFANLGLGRPRANVIGHTTIAIVNVVAGIWFGRLLGGIGVVIAYSASLTIGAILVIAMYCSHENRGLKTLLPIESLALALACIVSAGLVLTLYQSGPSLLVTTQVGFVVATLTLLWVHPLREQTVSKLRTSKYYR